MPERLPGKRVLIVEDNPVIAYDMSDLMSEYGAQPVGPAFDLETALRLAQESEFDAALLDIDLAGEYVWPLAQELARKTVPFVFVSGQCRDKKLPEELRDYKCISKPAARMEVVLSVAELCG